MDRLELARVLGASAAGRDLRDAATIVEEADPRGFMQGFADAVAAGGPVFLADPGWKEHERAMLAQVARQASSIVTTRGWLCIPTGGTSGGLKFARHDEETLAAAVRGFCAHFGVQRVNALGVLPLHHVGGLMAWLRCALTGGDYRPVEWKRLETGDMYPLSDTEAGNAFLSLVPTQLQRLLALPRAVEWLRGFRAIFVGGAPLWSELAEKAAAARLPISPGYGMTETAAMVTALKPEEFWCGARSSGKPLPHALVDVTADGAIRVGGDSVFLGYWPAFRAERSWTTDDLGRMDEAGCLHVLGRRDAVIITGGKKVQPLEVEAALRATGEFGDVAVIGVPDAEWGEAVVACYESGERAPDLGKVKHAIATVLSASKQPKRYVAVRRDEWPRNANGKVVRAALIERMLK